MTELKLSRREAIRNLAGAAALFGLSAEAIPDEQSALPAASLLKQDAEAYWNRLRDEQFLMPGVRAFLNTGSLGVTPKPVLHAVANYMHRAAELEFSDL